MNTSHHGSYEGQPTSVSDPTLLMGEFPKPNSFNMHPGRYDVHAYDRYASKYRAKKRNTLPRLLDAKLGHLRLGALLNPIIVVVLAVLVIAGGMTFANFLGSTLVAAPYRSGSVSDMQMGDLLPSSTPVEEWRKGEVPFLFQTDPAWATVKYAGDAKKPGSIGSHGCGPTCLSMVYIALTGKKDLSPVDMCAFAERNGYVDTGLTSWTLMSEGSAQLGLKVKELSASTAVLRQELAAGRPIICVVGPGDFTTTGHFLVIVGEDANGKLIIHDPNSTQRSSQAWDAERVLSQCRNLWSFSV